MFRNTNEVIINMNIHKNSSIFIMFFMKKINNFFYNKVGVLSFEFIMITLGVFFLIIIAVDFGFIFLQQGKIERINHSLASVLRERESLYSNGGKLNKYEYEYITQQDVDQLAKLAIKLMSSDNIALKVEQLHFKINNDKRRIDKNRSNQIDAHGLNGQCQLKMKPLIEFQEYSSKSKFNRWLPLYRVTLCVPAKKSIFKKFMNKMEGTEIVNEISVSNIVVPR